MCVCVVGAGEVGGGGGGERQLLWNSANSDRAKLDKLPGGAGASPIGKILKPKSHFLQSESVLTTFYCCF